MFVWSCIGLGAKGTTGTMYSSFVSKPIPQKGEKYSHSHFIMQILFSFLYNAFLFIQSIIQCKVSLPLCEYDASSIVGGFGGKKSGVNLILIFLIFYHQNPY